MKLETVGRYWQGSGTFIPDCEVLKSASKFLLWLNFNKIKVSWQESNIRNGVSLLTLVWHLICGSFHFLFNSLIYIFLMEIFRYQRIVSLRIILLKVSDIRSKYYFNKQSGILHEIFQRNPAADITAILHCLGFDINCESFV